MIRVLLALVFVAVAAPASAERLWSSGFEQAHCDEARSATSGGCTGTTSFDTTTKRSGTYSFLTATTAAASEYISLTYSAMATGDVFYFRAYIRISDAPDSNAAIFNAWNQGDSGWFGLTLTTGLNLQLVHALGTTWTQVGANSSALSLNTWYRIEFSGTWDTDGCVARLDGTEFASGTCSGRVAADRMRLGVGVDGATVANTTIYYDDVAFNSDDGATQNTWPGAGNIVHLRPNGAGDADTSVTLTGCATDGWNCVKEIGLDGSTTRADLTASTSLIDVAVDDVGTAPDADDTITLVQVGAYWASASNSAAGGKVRIKPSSGATVVTGTARAFSTTVFYANDQSASRPVYGLTCTTIPSGASCNGGSAWTTTALNDIQIGADANSDGNPDTWVSTLWALVEYVEVAGGGGGADAVQDVIGPTGVIPFPRSGVLEM